MMKYFSSTEQPCPAKWSLIQYESFNGSLNQTRMKSDVNVISHHPTVVQCCPDSGKNIYRHNRQDAPEFAERKDEV